MKEVNLELAKQDIEEALSTIETMEETLNGNDVPREMIKEKFLFLAEKVQRLENILKEEGIIE